MTSSPGSNERSDEYADLRAAIDRVTHGSASPEDLLSIERALADDPDARAFYLDYTLIHTALQWEQGTLKTLAIRTPAVDLKPGDALAPGVKTPTTPTSAAGVPMYRKGYEPQPFKLRARHYALIAATLLAACGLATYLLTTSVDPEPSPPEPSSPPALATLIHNTGNLRTPHGYPAEGDDYGRGEYTLATGTAEFMLTNAVNVKLRGNTRMFMRNNMNVALARGSAEFVVPKDAKGFTVHLPGGAKVVDLGTEFSVKIQDGDIATVTVDEGIVHLHTAVQDDAATVPVTAMTPRVTAKVDTATGKLIRVERSIDLADTGEGIAPGKPDPSWTIRPHVAEGDDTEPPAPAKAVVITQPPGPWLVPDDETAARWIGVDHPRGDSLSDAMFTFATTFDLAKADPRAVVIEAQVAADNQIQEIRVNGLTVVNSGVVQGSFADWRAFRIDDGFKRGMNRIEIDVYNTQDTVERTPMGLILKWHATETIRDTNSETATTTNGD